MRWTMGWTMLFFSLGLILFGGFLVLNKLTVLGLVLIGVGIFSLLGLKKIQEQERAVVELFGKYFMTLKAGLQWLLLGAMKERASIDIWEQQIPLFSDQEAEIVVRDGTVVPKDAKVFVKLMSPDNPYNDPPDPEKPASEKADLPVSKKKMSGVYRAIYKTPEWPEFIEDLIENALRSHLGQFEIDDLVIEGKGGFNLADHQEDVGLPNKVIEKIEARLAIWGWELLRITVTEFQLTPEEAKARQDIQIQKKEAEAAKYRAEQEAEETGGAVVQMFCKMTGRPRKDVEEELKKDPAGFVKKYESLWQKVWEIISQKIAIDADAYLYVRTPNSLTDIVTILEKLSKGGGKSTGKTEEKKTKQKGKKTEGEGED
jgi:regulator of protease activity HflC (stomatin/prohibitin superfamily)